ncbi:glycosyltransferase family 2 protein [Paenibacillus alkalitolerans]|uniref:glycosyltransferase family 2 protein n=1 Tax=Paenibacillus alkalitolerans TaxID=2799335 RepID=UPI0018F4FE84|nr:glycosyltransferase family 2 protein [Paenibacillus alkalitolerans]
MDLSIIIVNYNTRQLTLDCISSLLQSETSYKYEIVLVDNGSSDGSVNAVRSQFPSVNIIVNTENVGFSKANNQGIQRATGRYVLLLNSDTVVEPSTLSAMIDFMDRNPDVGTSGCKLVLPDGTLDEACKRGFPTPLASFYYAFGFSRRFPNEPKYNQYKLSHLNPNEVHEVDCLVGAFMIVRREVIQQIGGLDENFFMYGEDIDWCYRIKEAGWKVVYYPKTTVIHYKGASSRRKPLKIIYEFHRAMVLFHRKHYSRKHSIVVNFLVYAGISTKFLISLMKNIMKNII